MIQNGRKEFIGSVGNQVKRVGRKTFLIYRKVSNCYNESGNEHESFLVQMKTKAYNKYNLAYISN